MVSSDGPVSQRLRSRSRPARRGSHAVGLFRSRPHYVNIAIILLIKRQIYMFFEDYSSLCFLFAQLPFSFLKLCFWLACHYTICFSFLFERNHKEMAYITTRLPLERAVKASEVHYKEASLSTAATAGAVRRNEKYFLLQSCDWCVLGASTITTGRVTLDRSCIDYIPTT